MNLWRAATNVSVWETLGCVCSCVSCDLCRLQFEKHGSSLQKTKLKLLEAANLVDKVGSDAEHESHKQTDSSHPCRVETASETFLVLAVLQGVEHPRGVDRPGGLDQPGHDQRFRQPSQHSGSVPVLERKAAPYAPQRQRSTRHVSVCLCR